MATGFTEPLITSPRSTQQSFYYRSGMGMINNAEWIVFMEDFMQAEQATETISGFTSIIDAGATMVDGDEIGGVIDLTSDAADEGIALHQNLGIQLSGRKFFMEARVKITDADDGQIIIGLADLTAVTNPEDLWTTTPDFISFGNTVDGDATPVLKYDKNNGGPVTETPSGTTFDFTDNAFHTIAIWYNGATTASSTGALIAFFDGVEATRAATLGQIPDDLPLAPFIGALLEDDATDIFTIDYFRYAIER